MASRLLLLPTVRIYLGLSLALLVACGSDHHSTAVDAAPPTPDAPNIPDAPTLDTVVFSYTPSWSGVQTVEVWGGFGTATDWTAPFLTLAASGSAFAGSTTIAPGTYTSVFMVVGDDAAATAKQATYPRYAVDPTESSYTACPSISPTYDAKLGSAQNPCSQVTVPQGSAATLYPVSGTVDKAGSAAAGYLVVLERDEGSASHHYFVDRATTGSDGSYSMSVATGHYRVQVQYPEIESMTDAQLVPTSENILRRDISSAFDVAAAQAVPTVDMAYAGYATFAPAGSAAQQLPQTFTFPSGTSAKLDVYGGATEIGDPLYSGAATTTGSAMFKGTFSGSGAGSAVANTKYWWGLELPVAAQNGVTFTQQTMVLPITWSN